LILHYNASDDRGIDIIRKTIYNFIHSKRLLSNGIKFVILDEVDYMMPSAQKYLKNLMNLKNNIVYCLICNYISKIIPSLLSEFIILEYNKLYNNIDILKHIVSSENLNYSEKELQNISLFYKTDIRSMINYLYHNSTTIFNDRIYQDIVSKLHTETIKELILNYSSQLNISPKSLLHLCLNKYIRIVPFEYNFILFVEKVFIYSADVDYILHWWKHYNT
jgi:DNA polymerase III delta prime subunit